MGVMTGMDAIIMSSADAAAIVKYVDALRAIVAEARRDKVASAERGVYAETIRPGCPAFDGLAEIVDRQAQAAAVTAQIREMAEGGHDVLVARVPDTAEESERILRVVRDSINRGGSIGGPGDKS